MTSVDSKISSNKSNQSDNPSAKSNIWDDVFFSKSRLIKINSKEHTEFWTFYKKYQALIKRKPPSASVKADPQQTNKLSNVFKLPQAFDNRWRLNFAYKPNKKEYSSYDSHGNQIRFDQDEKEQSDFEFIIQLYLDFRQKDKFKKLKSLRKNQSNLPIFKYREAILQTIKSNQVTIVAGDTGCGKSTQIPRYLLEHEFEKIACTQPRRIACMSLAKRVGFETLNEYKSDVAYQVRFEKTRTKHTKILFLTEGVLLRQIQSDPALEQYDIIVVDEVHERHVLTDFLLGILKCLLVKRKDLKLILMSATINIDLFSNYFEGSVVFKIPGRTFKIDVEYLPVHKEKSDKKTSNKIDVGPFIRIMQMIDKKYPEDERGDMLIFLGGLSDIQTVYDAAKEFAAESKRWIILQLHSSLSIDEQDKVFDMAPDGVRKCILSTNIAETSITIDGLRFIVDSGKVKEISFDQKYKMQRLQEFWVSRASAEQRKGRAGRTGPGSCFRLYSREDYDAFCEFSTPEIKRVPLNTLLLQMISMGLENVRKFPFIESPSLDAIEHSLEYLMEQNAITSEEKITPIGRILSNLPVDIQVGKMLLMGAIFHVLDPVTIIAASLSVQSPFLSNLRCNFETMQSRKELICDHGDPLTLLNAYLEWIQIKTTNGSSFQWCKRRGIEEQRLYEMSKLEKQFRQMLQDTHVLRLHNDDSASSDEESAAAGTSSEAFSAQLRKRIARQQAKDKQKLLLMMRKQLASAPKRKKLLSVEENQDNYEIDEDAAEPDGNDIRDIDFKLMHDVSDLKKQAFSCKKLTQNELNFLKIIVTCGLFPQIALADEFNNYKRDSDQCFHCKHKSFVLIHPTSIFSYDPEVLECPGDAFVVDKLKYSSRHQLLVYVNLLETNKPYMMNLMRVPAMQTLLLYAKSLHTSADLTAILCDKWLELRFLDAEIAHKIFASIILLRAKMELLFKLCFSDDMDFLTESVEDADADAANQASANAERMEERNHHMKERSAQIKHVERALKKKLIELLELNVSYSIRRVMPAELKTIFNSSQAAARSTQDDDDDLDDADKNMQTANTSEFALTDYFTFNSLRSDTARFEENTRTSWTCSFCTEEFFYNIKEKLEHEIACVLRDESESSAKNKSSSKKKATAAASNSYFCAICRQTLNNLTPIDILKHKKSHNSTAV